MVNMGKARTSRLGGKPPVAGSAGAPYLHSRGWREAAAGTMNQTETKRLSLLPVAIGSLAVLMLAGTVGLWSYYGTAVFFEIIRTGWAACF
jgi:hypothetical protein